MGNIFTIQLDLGSIFTSCTECVVGKASYVHDLKDNLEALQKKLEELSQAKDDVKKRFDVAEQKPMRQRLNQVQLWLTRVQEVEAQVDQLLQHKSQEIEKLCLGGFCSKNLKSSYKFGKKVAKLLQVVADLKRQGTTFLDVEEKPPADPVDERPSEPTIGLESKLKEVWSYIGERRVKIIGLYGKGGVGKTTLLTQINNKFLNLPNDIVVIWVLVSKDLQLEKIQETIGKKIGFSDKWNEKSVEEKALDIFKNLTRKKFVLLLDDIWERVDLIKIGIPPPSKATDFKVVFTTRSIEVCGHMEAHKKVEVERLTHSDAWKLFREKVGEETLNSHPDIPSLAKKVARECGGLPLALITIGRAMAGKNQPEEWKFAISILSMSAHEFPGMENDVYFLLKFSYDRLPSDIHRACFLYCSLFPEDFYIAKTELIDCWISEGFLKKYDGILARNFGYNIIGFLLRACLLERGEEDHSIKMHDVIRDMALWIACEVEKEKFFVRSGVGLKRAPEVQEWENVKRMSLMKNKIDSLPERPPNCPELLSLFIHNNPLGKFPKGFLQHMCHLQVLNLSGTPLAELPKGISKLVELRHLDLSSTKIIELPNELKALTNLKCLNLENTEHLCKIPQDVISNLSMLRVLRMFRCGYFSIESKDSILFDEGELFIEEVVCLKHLNVFSVNFKNSNSLRRYLSSHELLNCPAESVSLRLVDNSKSLNVLSLRVLKDLHTLYISSMDLVELVIDCEMRDLSQFNSLHTVYLHSCWKLREVTWLIFAPNLKILDITVCNDMKELIDVGVVVPEMKENLPFARLQRLTLQYLRKLETIYCAPLPFPHLKEIHIMSCPNLKKLPLGSNSMTVRAALKITGDQQWWNELQWEDQATRDHFLPFFNAFS